MEHFSRSRFEESARLSANDDDAIKNGDDTCDNRGEHTVAASLLVACFK